KGKVGYMAPEQARGQRVDRRCDVWAAGVVAWELFAGERLYGGKDPVATALEIVTTVPKRLGTAKPQIPQKGEAAVHSALAKDVDRRCPSASAFRACLLDACDVAPASPAEVAAYVRGLVGDVLEDRRLRAQEIARLRKDVARLASAGVVETTG